MKTSNTLTIFITPIKGEEICIEKTCTLKQAVTLAKKEARKAIHNGGIFVTINIIARVPYGVETLVHIEAEKQGRRVAFSDDQPTETPSPENNTPSTMNAKETTEFSELSHAGQRLDNYLHNDSFIYEYYTQKAIEAIVNDGLSITSEDVRRYVRNAIDHASFQVEKYDHLTPTAQDVEQVTRNYVAYIVDCAK